MSTPSSPRSNERCTVYGQAMAFTRVDSDEPARVVLEQVGPTEFLIKEPFQYRDTVSGRTFVVHASTDANDTTDLASVPGLLLWFVPRYGRHTLPALLHDQIVDEDLRDNREEADRVFRDAMGEQGVPLLRRWVMWAAVSLDTVTETVGRWIAAPIALWLLAWSILPVRFTPPLMSWGPLLPIARHLPLAVAIPVAIVGPWLGAVAWTNRYLVGVVSAYAIILLVVPLAVVALAVGLYQASEWATGIIRPRHIRATERTRRTSTTMGKTIITDGD
jgi:Protein of unknown function (DUF1353)